MDATSVGFPSGWLEGLSKIEYPTMLNLPFIQFGIYPNSDAGQHMVETILEPERDARRDAGSALVSESGDALDFLDPSQLAW